jgi:hypothetical protein
MPKRKATKPVIEMTTDELADKVFPKEVKKKLQEIANPPGSKAKNRSSHE